MSMQRQGQLSSELPIGKLDIVLPFTTIDRASLPLVGGKAANLGELTRAGLPVPPGFCVTTAAYALVADRASLETILVELDTTVVDNRGHLAALAAAARASLLAAAMPDSVTGAIIEAYRALGNGALLPVAVRSSATAEDLPYASFAGQQDTYLNRVGIEAVLDAVKRCWASLWTDRAVSYRASLGIDHRTVRLAVAVQHMVDATVAGVLFTANPLTGHRRQAVIDASPGLGEAVVSGAVNPDHFVVHTTTGEIIERRLGDKRIMIRTNPDGGTRRVELEERTNQSCLSDEQIRALAELGARVEAHYGAPQDTEWAIDASGHLWLTQARPITTLFPLPASAPETDEVLRVYFSANVAQGVYRPFTPMGFQAFRLMGSSIATFANIPPRDRLTGPYVVSEAAYRLFFDMTPALRSTLGRTLVGRIMHIMETRTANIFQQLYLDPRLAPVKTRRWPLFRTMVVLLARSRAPLHVLQALVRPAAARARVTRLGVQLQALSEVPANASASERLDTVERLFFGNAARILGSIVPIIFSALGANALAGKLLGGLATADERQTILRGLPYNPTTEMNLALWALAEQSQADPAAAQALRATSSEQLARDYRSGTLPPTLQRGLEDFLALYGHRGVAEIDLGLPRWSEDPTHILGVLTNYLQLKNSEQAPDVQFRRGAQEGEAMVAELTRRARSRGRLRGMLVNLCLRRVRDLGGLRETPKFYLVVLLARARALLWPVGEELVEAGKIEAAEDIFFLNLSEARAALAGKDMRALVREHHTIYEQELNRRHVPRVLLSDGTEPSAKIHAAGQADGILRGTPASAGVVTAKARVILDPTGARLEPGEILVAPSTDPGWTPLFLTAGGLVMEMGGAMSHGSVVAREYGIPAVVGVPGASERITTGQEITVDGSAGTIFLEQERNQAP